MVDTSFKKVIRFLLSVLLVLSVVATLVGFLFRYILCDRTVYTKAAKSPAFIESVHTSLLNSLESECLFYDLPFETIKKAVDQETVEALVETQIASLYDALFNGMEFSEIQWDTTNLKQTVQSFFDTLPEQERPSDTVAQTIADDLVKTMVPILHFGLSDKLLVQGHAMVQKTAPLQQLASLAVWLLALTIVMAVGLWLVSRKGIAQRLQTVSGMIFLGSSVVAVPFWLLKRYDFPSRLVLAESALKQYVNGVLYPIVDYSVTVTSVVFAVSALLLVVSVILKTTRKQQ